MNPDNILPGGCLTRREPLAAYLDRVDFVSSSVLRRFARTGVPPGVDFKPPPVPKEATLGDALHALMLEPERFDDEYFDTGSSAPPPKGLDTDGLMTRTWLSSAACNALEAMRRSILVHTRAPLAEWFGHGEKELSIYWSDDDGTRWKARPDCLTADAIVELKTATDIRPGQFAKSRRRFGYDLQAAHYVDGVQRLTGQRPRFVYVAVESVRPHSVWVYELRQEELAGAASELTSLKSRFAEARRQARLIAAAASPAPDAPTESCPGDTSDADEDAQRRRTGT